jgi:glucuronosyltransferase
MTLTCACAGSRILFVFPTPSKSQMVVGESLMKLLAQNNHEVTVVSLFPLEKPMKNYRDVKINFEGDLSEIFKKLVGSSAQKLSMELMNELFSIADKIGPVFMESVEMKKLMEEEKFDLIILGFVPLNNFMVGLADHFSCPLIFLNTAEVHTSLLTLMGNPLEVNSVPHFLISSSRMDTFMNRVKNFLISTFDLTMGVYVDYLENKKYR